MTVPQFRVSCLYMIGNAIYTCYSIDYTYKEIVFTDIDTYRVLRIPFKSVIHTQVIPIQSTRQYNKILGTLSVQGGI